MDVELAATASAALGVPVSFLFHVLRGRLLVVRDGLLLTGRLTERTARDYHDGEPLVRRATVEAFSR